MDQVELKTKLVWQCRRGMLELDVILNPFLEEHFDELNLTQQQVFTDLLNEADPDLYSWLMGYENSENQLFNEMIQIIRNNISIK